MLGPQRSCDCDRSALRDPFVGVSWYKQLTRQLTQEFPEDAFACHSYCKQMLC